MRDVLNDSLYEFESKFIEYVYYDYLLKNGEITQDEYKNFKAIHNNSLKNEIGVILQENDIVNIMRQINKSEDKNLFQMFDES